jgi:hypothetical protein
MALKKLMTNPVGVTEIVDDVSKIVRGQTDDGDLRMEDLLKGAPKFN